MAFAMPTFVIYRQRFGYQTANNDLKPNKFYCSYTTNLKL